MASDIDIVVLTLDPASYAATDGWVEGALGEVAPVVRTMEWGPLLTERRVRLASGLEVDIGFAPPSWAAADAVDPGTAGVVADGFRALFDPDDLLSRLVNVILEAGRQGG